MKFNIPYLKVIITAHIIRKYAIKTILCQSSLSTSLLQYTNELQWYTSFPGENRTLICPPHQGAGSAGVRVGGCQFEPVTCTCPLIRTSIPSLPIINILYLLFDFLLKFSSITCVYSLITSIIHVKNDII